MVQDATDCSTAPDPTPMNDQVDLDFISNIYGAAVERRNWPEVLDRLAQVFGAKNAVLIVLGHSDGLANMAEVSPGWPPDSVAEYFEMAGKYEANAFVELGSVEIQDSQTG